MSASKHWIEAKLLAHIDQGTEKQFGYNQGSVPKGQTVWSITGGKETTSPFQYPCPIKFQYTDKDTSTSQITSKGFSMFDKVLNLLGEFPHDIRGSG